MPDTHPPGVEEALREWLKESSISDLDMYTTVSWLLEAYHAAARWAWDAALEAAAKVCDGSHYDGEDSELSKTIRALKGKG